MFLKQLSIRRASRLSIFLLTLAFTHDGLAQVELIATVLKTSSFPEPANADYKDCLTVIQFRADRFLAGTMPETTFLVVAWAFEDRKLAEPGTFREGDSMRLKLVDYKKVASTYDGIMRVDNTNDLLSRLYWATDWGSIHRDPRESTFVGEPILPSWPSNSNESSEKVTGEETGPGDRAQRAKIIKNDIARMTNEVERRGGYKAWREQLAPFRSELRSRLSEVKASGSDIFIGEDDFLFSRSRMQYLLDSTLLYSENARGEQQYSNAFSSIQLLSKQLKDRNIDLIVVPIPTQAEVYPDKYSERAPEKLPVTPHRHEFILELLKSDVEVLDLLPAFLRARGQSEQSLYRLDDPHWNTRGIKIAARDIAERLSRYPWVAADSTRAAAFSTRIENVEVPAALRKGMAPKDLAAYPNLSATRLEQVLGAGGKLYQDVEDAPILIAGDSYCFIFANHKAGLTAHLANELNAPVSMLARSGMGPTVPMELARKGAGFINQRRVILWVFVSRYLTPSMAPMWQPVKLPVMEPVPVLNASFEQWTVDRQAMIWSNPSGLTEPADDARLGRLCLKLVPNDDKRGTFIQQTLHNVGPIGSRTVALELDAKIGISDKLVLAVYFTEAGVPGYVMRRFEGSGQWRTIKLEEIVPSAADPDAVTLKVILENGAREPALVDNVRFSVSR